MERCSGCVRYLRSCTGMSEEVCEKNNLRIPKTNAFRIREMTDEDLAEFISHVSNGCDYMLPECDAYGYCHGNCKTGWLEWLEAEVKDGTTD